MSEVEHPDLHGVRVLVVDDDADNCEVLAAVLELSGARVVTAQSAADALLSFEKEIPHVLISDIGLPGEDGLALLRQVRARSPSQGGNVPAIALTGYTHLEKGAEPAHGFHARLTKPVDFDQVIAAVARALESRAG
jgi:CheY-like chemotaxis protein